MLTDLSLTAVETAAGVALSPTTMAVLGTASLLFLLPMFLLARFSFGYTLGVGFFGAIAGFVWLSYFSSSQFDHAAARWSVTTSLLACPFDWARRDFNTLCLAM
jgi:hypothetical protein